MENSKDVVHVPVQPSVETSQAKISIEIHSGIKATLEALMKPKIIEFHMHWRKQFCRGNKLLGETISVDRRVKLAKDG